MSEKPEKLIDISSLAHESGASMIWRDSSVWWEFSPHELQLFVEKVLAANTVPIECGTVLVGLEYRAGYSVDYWNMLPSGAYKLFAVRCDDDPAK